jgi:hypothetical protein
MQRIINVSSINNIFIISIINEQTIFIRPDIDNTNSNINNCVVEFLLLEEEKFQDIYKDEKEG